ncbi:MAG: hypothetical protein ABS944_06115 [Solibacillus sp.]
MWIITVFNNRNDIRMFEYNTKNEATQELAKYSNAVLSYTN